MLTTAQVKSNIARTHRTLPEDSIYLPLAKEYNERLVHSQSQGVPNEDYARRVVYQLINKPKRDHIWEGGKSWLIWWVSNFLPRRVMDLVMSRMFKLWKLRGTYQKKIA